MVSKSVAWILLLFFFSLSSLFSTSYSDARATEASLHCGGPAPPPGSSPPRRGNVNFISGFVREMENLSQNISVQHWALSFVNSTPPMYGLAQCFSDLSRTDCILCYAAIRTKVPRCLPSTAARIYLDGCFLRYDSYEFYNQSTDPGLDSVNCTASVRSIAGESSAADFPRTVDLAVGWAVKEAVGGGGFGVGEGKGAVESVFALAQCWKSVSKEGCQECLEKARNKTNGCVPKREGRGMNAGCYLRYSTVKFYGQQGGSNSGGNECLLGF